MDTPFGENIDVDGEKFTAELLCVGDILEVMRDDKVVCIFQITSPRWPCFKIDIKHSKTLTKSDFTEKVRAYCGETGLAGIFCKVIQEGTIKIGDKLILKERIHNEWTLSRVSNLLYGGENKKKCLIERFQGTEEELQSLLKLKELAAFEWKDRLEKYIEKRNEKKKDEVKENIENINIDNEIRVIQVPKKKFNFTYILILSIIIIFFCSYKIKF